MARFYLVRIRLLSGHLLVESWSVGLPLFCELSYFHFGGEGGTLVLIAYVPGHCLPLTFSIQK